MWIIYGHCIRYVSFIIMMMIFMLLSLLLLLMLIHIYTLEQLPTILFFWLSHWTFFFWYFCLVVWLIVSVCFIEKKLRIEFKRNWISIIDLVHLDFYVIITMCMREKVYPRERNTAAPAAPAAPAAAAAVSASCHLW